MYFIETDRLKIRRLNATDLDNIKETLEDPVAMYAYEGAFNDKETESWLKRQLDRYKEYGLGLWAVEDKATSEFLGQCGLTYQPWNDKKVLEIGYLFNRRHWGKGYAIEASKATKEFAFNTLGAKEVCSIIRDTNTSSMRVAIRNGMLPRDTSIKHYKGVDMLHIRFVAEKGL